MSKQSLNALRTDAGKILDACLRAADPRDAVKRFVLVRGDTVEINGSVQLALGDFDRVVVVGAGKGSAAMAQALEDILEDRIDEGIVCVKYDHGLPLATVRVLEGGHPVPDQNGVRAAREIVELVRSLGPRDLVFSCISGGGSALLPAPPDGITLEQKQNLTHELLAVGANIHEINAVRKHLSLTKGGNLMASAYPARVINLMLSDVVGDDPDTIASGPFVPDRSTFRQALDIFHRYGLMDRAPAEIVRRIQDGAEGKIPETPKEGDSVFQQVENVIVGSNILALKAGAKAAKELGYGTLILSSSIEGDTSQAALFHGAIAHEIRVSENPLPPPACILSGGETTVTIRGNGKGGRNQEFVLALVRKVARIPECLILSAGTDGTDGPTDAAGALVDSLTHARGSSMGLDPDEYLRNNDSYHYFRTLDDLIVTGPTRTNVMDVRIMLLGHSRV